MEHVLTMVNLKLKPYLFTPRPSVCCWQFVGKYACNYKRGAVEAWHTTTKKAQLKPGAHAEMHFDVASILKVG